MTLQSQVEMKLCEQDHLFFTRRFFKPRFGVKFSVNWHHQYISYAIDQVIQGKIKNLVINVSPGGSKTELLTNLIARGLALNPRSKFLYLSYSQSLVDDVTALIGKMNEQYHISSRLSEVIQKLGGDLGWIEVLFHDVMEAVDSLSSSFEGIDPSILDALKSTLTDLYNNVKDNFKYIFEFGETLYSAFTSALDAVSPLFAALLHGKESVSGLSVLFDLLRMAMATASDATFGLNIGLKIVLSAIQFLAGGIFSLSSSILNFIGFNTLAEQASNASDRLFAQAEKNVKDVADLTEKHKWSVVKTYEDINKTQKEKDAESVASSKAKLDQLLSDQKTEVEGKKVSEQEKINAVKAYAEASMQANKGVLDGMTQADLLTIEEYLKKRVTKIVGK